MLYKSSLIKPFTNLTYWNIKQSSVGFCPMNHIEYTMYRMYSLTSMTKARSSSSVGFCPMDHIHYTVHYVQNVLSHLHDQGEELVFGWILSHGPHDSQQLFRRYGPTAILIKYIKLLFKILMNSRGGRFKRQSVNAIKVGFNDLI